MIAYSVLHCAAQTHSNAIMGIISGTTATVRSSSPAEKETTIIQLYSFAVYMIQHSKETLTFSECTINITAVFPSSSSVVKMYYQGVLVVDAMLFSCQSEYTTTDLPLLVVEHECTVTFTNTPTFNSITRQTGTGSAVIELSVSEGGSVNLSTASFINCGSSETDSVSSASLHISLTGTLTLLRLTSLHIQLRLFQCNIHLHHILHHSTHCYTTSGSSDFTGTITEFKTELVFRYWVS